MRNRPNDFTDDVVGHALSAGWGRRAVTVEHRPVGFGSHHWSIVDADRARWFLTVDDLDTKRTAGGDRRTDACARLRSALRAARAARDASARFVVAPEPTLSGDVVHEISERYVAALHSHIDGRAGTWGAVRSDEDRVAVLALLVQLHTLPADIAARADADDLTVPHRDELEVALGDLDRAWEAGPHGEAARALLDRHAAGVVRMLAHHDRLAGEARTRPERAVLTHGEPHPGNTIRTDEGLVLVDWDTARRAPPERDLWMLGDDAASAAAYEAATGRPVLSDAMELYRLSWDLAEIGIYVHQFRAPHGDSADEQLARSGLEHHLDPDGRWPHLV